jgi:hypothetical protein
MRLPQNGGCHCGKVRYEISQQPLLGTLGRILHGLCFLLCQTFPVRIVGRIKNRCPR